MDLKHIIERLKAAKLQDYNGNPLESLEAFMELDRFANQPTLPRCKCSSCGMLSFGVESRKLCHTCNKTTFHVSAA